MTSTVPGWVKILLSAGGVFAATLAAELSQGIPIEKAIIGAIIAALGGVTTLHVTPPGKTSIPTNPTK